MSSTGGVVRTGSKPFAGTPDRPRTVRVSSNPSAYGRVLARSAAVMSRLLSVEDASGAGVLGTGVPTEPVGEALGVASGGMQPARRTSSTRSDGHRRRIIFRGTPRRAFACRRPGLRGNIGGGGAPRWGGDREGGGEGKRRELCGCAI